MLEDNDTVGAGAPAWVTVKVAVAPPAVTVTTPERDEVDVFGATVTTRLAPLAPEDGLNVNHDWLEEACQVAWLVVTVTPWLPAPEGADQMLEDNDTVAEDGNCAVTVYCPE